MVGRSEEAAAKTTQHDQQGPSSISASTSSISNSSSSTSISRTSSISTKQGPTTNTSLYHH